MKRKRFTEEQISRARSSARIWRSRPSSSPRLPDCEALEKVLISEDGLKRLVVTPANSA
ncbi:hypothetical protein FBZ94_1011042 [Bradyrhizobium sacchari]|uniref:Uncharacterized protein n=1 Tax=Bradyrhizobium sacchari TaxID=1399419 RepID=A0A560KN40_9BRAD|nr:hypothetical protein FBZ94_1011042 [Bradyrhizobium sacchari]TWB84597.1 hypothetical protein FBZ95_1011042 [Bradyrhizobium sacchari]